jgi:multiple sugar transport system substrate-binding protein
MAGPGRSLKAAALVGLFLSAGCGETAERPLQLWGLGREGEVVPELIPAFERAHAGTRVQVQQIPWTAAHEKILTAFVGESGPDLAQVGNTWIPELAAIGAIEPLDAYVAGSRAVLAADFFPGVWQTNVVDGHVWGIPWYVDTRLLFYRRDLLAEVGFPEAPRTWSGWLESMRRLEARAGPEGFPLLLPTDEWQPLVAMALQKGAPLLKDGDRRGFFEDPRFRAAFDVYREIYRRGYAPVVSNSQVGNLYQQFAQGTFCYFITGPWNLGEFRRRLPPAMQDRWATAPLPAPDGTPWPGVSVAGGASLVIFRSSQQKARAWELIEHLSRTEQQVRFFKLTGDLPTRQSAWSTPELAGDPQSLAFRDQLLRVEPTPKVPEWEQIVALLMERTEAVIRGRVPPERALAALDDEVDRLLEKRRWLLAQRAQKEKQ